MLELLRIFLPTLASVFRKGRVQPSVKTPPASGYLAPLRRKCLDWLIILGDRHLVLVLRQYSDHYNRARPHRPLGLRPPDPQPTLDHGVIVRRQRLHGLINEYPRAA